MIAPSVHTNAPSERIDSAIHIIVTKFNVVLSYAPGSRKGLDPSWLEERFEMFAKWPLESVKRQTRRPARWMVFVDARTDGAYLSRLQALSAGAADIIPFDGVLTDGDIRRIVGESLPRGRGPLITTRLDSDDALAPTYLETIAAHASDWRGFVNPRNGLLYAGGTVLRRLDFSSPFLSLIEDRKVGELPLTVFSVEHQRAHTIAQVRQLGGSPLWMQVVHGDNLGNGAQGFPYSRRRAERLFARRFTRTAADPKFLARAARTELRQGVVWSLQRLRRPQ